jgi:hypothetical protein
VIGMAATSAEDLCSPLTRFCGETIIALHHTPQPNGQPRMNRERLTQLAILLDGYRDSHTPRFDLQSWGESETQRGGFLWLRQHTCNTAACAVGLACGSGVFAEDGLSYDEDANGGLTPIFGGIEGWSAVKSFFDLDQTQAVRLFAEHSYDVTEGEAAAQAVAARIRQMTAVLDTPIQEAQGQ